MASLIQRINKFESLPRKTVQEFNKIFTEQKLDGFDLEDEVKIGEIFGPANVRTLRIDGDEVQYAFSVLNTEDLRYTDYETNENLENLVLEEKELELDPFEYKLLQYFRGCQSTFHTQVEIAAKMKKSLRGLRSALARMEQKKIISTEFIAKVGKTTVTINEEWL